MDVSERFILVLNNALKSLLVTVHFVSYSLNVNCEFIMQGNHEDFFNKIDIEMDLCSRYLHKYKIMLKIHKAII